jgi:ribulose-5-phosphate 4-epimerase/fuculose-1-phosphate aldolase
MSSVTSLNRNPQRDEEWRLRVDLAAAFRLAVYYDWHESIANHFSLAVSPDGKKFLMNPKWRHFSRIRASDLDLLDADDKEIMNRPNPPDASAWCIHGHLHGALAHARCILHCHPPYATAIAALEDPELKPIEQNTARYYNRIVVDKGYGGIADQDEEGRRLVRALGNGRIMMMGHHGVLVVGDTVGEAFDDLYYLERACKTMVLAYSTGQKLNIMSPELAERTAKGWEAYRDSALVHFEEMKLVLDREDPSYRD